jgi:hypothetical protein
VSSLFHNTESVHKRSGAILDQDYPAAIKAGIELGDRTVSFEFTGPAMPAIIFRINCFVAGRKN